MDYPWWMTNKSEGSLINGWNEAIIFMRKAKLLWICLILFTMFFLRPVTSLSVSRFLSASWHGHMDGREKTWGPITKVHVINLCHDSWRVTLYLWFSLSYDLASVELLFYHFIPQNFQKKKKEVERTLSSGSDTFYDCANDFFSLRHVATCRQMSSLRAFLSGANLFRWLGRDETWTSIHHLSLSTNCKGFNVI